MSEPTTDDRDRADLASTAHVDERGDALSPSERPPLEFHKHRALIMRETHARPPLSINSPCVLTRITLMPKGQGGSHEIAAKAIERAFAQSGQPTPQADQRQVTCDLGVRRITIERQTELVTITIVAPGEGYAIGDALDDTARQWITGLNAVIVAAIHTQVFEDKLANIDTYATKLLGTDNFAAFQAEHGPIAVASNFTPHLDGFERIVFVDEGATPAFLGRTVQRVLEAECYRIAAMLAFPEALEVAKELDGIENQLDGIIAKLAAPPHMSNDRNLLIDVSRIAGQVEELGHRTSFRLGAARAYSQLVLERMDQLHETRIEGRQRFSSFINRRLAPAMRTCEATEQRRRDITERVTQAINLLRARVNVAMEEQSAQLLNSLDRRSSTQLRLQETVEGLSVIAVTYYAVGLVSYLAKVAETSGMPIKSALVTGISVPVIALIAALGLRRMKQKIKDDEAQS